ncbi:MAG: bifunctional serine/threonine-protein kinase/formylglycine-generating enzyme family protein [Chloroflexota bacterium]
MPLSSGQVLNKRYRVVRPLGQGGFGAVYRAWDLNLSGPCAIKENFDTSPESQKQFAREASLLFNLRHPALPKVFDAFSLPGQGQYLVMEYIEGQDLEQLLQQAGGPLDEAQALPWIEQVCEALVYLHGQEPPVIHRDLKPANIRITPQGQAVLVDFGIAKLYDAQLRTTMGARAVTPGFSPPEQYGGSGGTDARSDIYALGATLYTLFTGHAPPESVEVISGVAAPPIPARQVNPRLSAAVSAALERALQVNRAARFASMAEFKEALFASPAPQSPAAPPVVLPTVVVPTTAPAAAPAAAPPAAPPLSPARPVSEMSVTLAPGVTLAMVRVPAGEFLMGSNPKKDNQTSHNEQPQQRVHLDEYWMGKYPVTNRQYQAFVQATHRVAPSHWKNYQIPPGKEEHPVVNVNWDDAAAFCRWAGQQGGRVMRLPTEAQWEKAASWEGSPVIGGKKRRYPWGEQPPDKSRCNCERQVGDTTPAGRYSPQGDSFCGCVDLAGNVWEWCADWYAWDAYAQRSSSELRNPLGPSAGQHRALRGGSWQGAKEMARCAARYGGDPNIKSNIRGFRCCAAA